MSQEKKFIKTTDKETAEHLISAGFQLVSQSGNAYTFLNQLPRNFSFTDADKVKVAYTNLLNI
jgi:hypothetical protein